MVTKWLQISYKYFRGFVFEKGYKLVTCILGALFWEMVTKWLQTSYMYFRGFVLENCFKLVTCILEALFWKIVTYWLQGSYMYYIYASFHKMVINWSK